MFENVGVGDIASMTSNLVTRRKAVTLDEVILRMSGMLPLTRLLTNRTTSKPSCGANVD